MLNLTDENFEKEIQNNEKPILVDFWAEWCFPCTLVTPILEKISEGFKEKLILAEVNINEAPITAQKFGIDRIPTIIFFKNGKPINGFVGLRSEIEIKEWLEENLK